MGVRARWVRYGRDAAEALCAEIAASKDGEPLSPVTVVVPSNQVGVSARRLLASGTIGSPCGSGTGLVAVTFLTPYRLAELLGAPALAGTGRRPVSTPVLTAGVRASLNDDPGLFAPVAAHPATEAALVAAYRELRDCSSEALDALAGLGQRAADVVRLHRATRTRLQEDWYDEEDLMTAATSALAMHRTQDDLGTVILYLPQRLSRHASVLLRAAADDTDIVVLAGTTGDSRADAEVVVSLGGLGAEMDVPAPVSTPDVALGRTRFFSASDADEEVRQAVRAVIDAARSGTPLDRVAILHASPEPYDRLVREQLSAAGIAANGATDVPISARVAGRTLLQLLELPALGFRRQDVFSWLAAAPVRIDGHRAPVTGWERLSRDAGVVGGRDQWDSLLITLAEELEARASAADEDPDQADWLLDKWRDDGERTRQLRTFVLDLIDRLAHAAEQPLPWSTWAQWAHDWLRELLGGSGRRGPWPVVERKAAERVELALDRLAALDAVEGAVDLDVFSRTLAIELESDLGREGRFGEGVLVGSIGMAVGLDLDLVILLGLAEGSLPAPVHDDSLLPDDERESARGELALRSQRVDRQHRQFLAALAGAKTHLLGIPRGDLRRSSARVPSRWALDVASVLAGERWWTRELFDAKVDWVDHIASFDAGVRAVSFPATEQEHRLRAFLAAAAPRHTLHALAATTDSVTAAGIEVIDARRSTAFTRFDGNLCGLTIPSPVDAGTSATGLERWAICPYAYLVQTLFKVQPIENPEELLEISPLDKGRLVHEALELFIGKILERSLADQPAPGQPWSTADRELLLAIADALCTQYQASGLTGRAIFWRRERAIIMRDLLQFLDMDDAYRGAEGARPIAAELAFGLRGGDPPVAFPLPDGRSVPLRGKADRVDLATDGTIQVLDYKTGGSKDFPKLTEDNPDEHGTKLQLAIYGQAARNHQQDPDAAVRANYWFVSTKGKFKKVGYCVTADVIDHVSETLASIVRGIEHGIFPCHPEKPTTSPFVKCKFCDPDGLGTADLRRQWERKHTHADMVPYVELADPMKFDSEDDALVAEVEL